MNSKTGEPDYTMGPGRRRVARFVRPLQYGLFLLLSGMAGILPIRASQRLGGWLGGALYRPIRRTREVCLNNLRAAFPDLDEEARDQLAHQVFRNVGVVLMEFLAGRRFRREIKHWVKVEGEEVLRALHAEGRGVVVITAHLGNWEIQPLVFEQLRLPTVAVGRFLVSPWINKLLLGLRENPFFTVIRQESAGSSRDLLRAIKAGDLLVTFMDLDTHGSGVFVDFFGIPAYTTKSPASLALRHGLPVVTGFDRRLPDGTHVFRFERVALPPALKEKGAAVREATQIITHAIEAQVRERPEQWIWVHKRWRRRPGRDGRPVIIGNG